MTLSCGFLNSSTALLARNRLTRNPLDKAIFSISHVLRLETGIHLTAAKFGRARYNHALAL